MKTILFERHPQSYLPEIDAYIDYIKHYLDGWTGIDSHDVSEINSCEYDIIWKFMGFDLCKRAHAVVHEYNSLSTGMLPQLKNQIKKRINVKPDRRVFLNENVLSQFNFRDQKPYTIRPMGIKSSFYKRNGQKEYDFVYAGSLAGRKGVVYRALNHFKNNLKQMSLLVIGCVPDDIYAEFSSCSNITFVGRVLYSQVPALASRAVYGLNLIPDVYPLNIQTATKVLEYCAMGLKIVSTDYAWSRQFEKEYGAKLFFLKDDWSNFTEENVQKFDYQIPTLLDLEWSRCIENSGVFDFLN